MTDRPAKNRSLGITLAVAAALCLIYAGFSSRWLVNGSRFGNIGFGLRTNSICQPLGFGDGDKTTCVTKTNRTVVAEWQKQDPSGEYTSGAFAPTGWATLIEMLLGSVGLLAAAGLAIARKRPELPIAPTTVALLGVMVALITGCVFVATKPGPPGFVGVGLGFWLFGIGCVVGIAGAQMLAKVNRPLDPDLGDGAIDPDAF
jgi:hypothetical protein